MATVYVIGPKERLLLLSPSSQREGDELDAILRSIREAFDREGYVLIRGLLDDDLLQKVRAAGTSLVNASAAPGKTFASLDFGAVFNFDGGDSSGDEPTLGDAFREVALSSAIPAMVAEVLRVDATTNLRLLKDAFLAKGPEQKHCGWHVDDLGFWPTDASSSGVNGWLALDDMPCKYGGGMAVSPKSHVAEWKEDAYNAIGSTPLLPEGGLNVDFMKSVQTCDMASMDAKMNDAIESTKLEFDFRAGDCLLCNRWLFHRSVEVNQEGLKHYEVNGGLPLKRYTIRYERGSAKLIKGVCLEPAVLIESGNGGKTLDDVSCDIPYYPKCWPREIDSMAEQEAKMKALACDTLPAVQEKRAQAMKDIYSKMKIEANVKRYD
ncbi:hypothetical protein ACHAWF_006322 [Thalassiosira exigua]